MKRKAIISFCVLIIVIIIMRWQGAALITPQTPNGIVDVELARYPERFSQLLLFLGRADLYWHLLLDFIFLGAYGWFFYVACRYVGNKTAWPSWGYRFASIGISAALFDAMENLLLLLVLSGKFTTSLVEVIYWTAIIKFILAGFVVLFLVFAWPFSLRQRST